MLLSCKLPRNVSAASDVRTGGQLKFRRTGALQLMARLKRHDRSFVRERFGLRYQSPVFISSLRMLLGCFTIAASLGVLLDVAPVERTQNIEDKIVTGTNPPGLLFVLTTRNGQKLFHLGEIIEIEEDYSSLAGCGKTRSLNELLIPQLHVERLLPPNWNYPRW